MPDVITARADALHLPGRVHCLMLLEEHLNKSSSLARALWLALEDAGLEDERDRDALYELASAVADHASAAVYIFYHEEEVARAKADLLERKPATVFEEERQR